MQQARDASKQQRNKAESSGPAPETGARQGSSRQPLVREQALWSQRAALQQQTYAPSASLRGCAAEHIRKRWLPCHSVLRVPYTEQRHGKLRPRVNSERECVCGQRERDVSAQQRAADRRASGVTGRPAGQQRAKRGGREERGDCKRGTNERPKKHLDQLLAALERLGARSGIASAVCHRGRGGSTLR